MSELNSKLCTETWKTPPTYVWGNYGICLAQINDVPWCEVLHHGYIMGLKLSYIDEKSFSGETTIVADSEWSEFLKNA